jgi:hypothetical protein
VVGDDGRPRVDPVRGRVVPAEAYPAGASFGHADRLRRRRERDADDAVVRLHGAVVAGVGAVDSSQQEQFGRPERFCRDHAVGSVEAVGIGALGNAGVEFERVAGYRRPSVRSRVVAYRSKRRGGWRGV